MRFLKKNIVIGAVVALAVVGVSGFAFGDHHEVAKAIAVIHGTDGNDISGTVTFEETVLGVKVYAHIMGLSKGQHGFHIHHYGDLSSGDGKSAGGHFNPHGRDHAASDSMSRHVGDLGNIEANNKGMATLTTVDIHLQLSGPNSIIGRAVVIHGGEDDLTSQPSGAAGPRVGVGVIALAAPGEPSGDTPSDDEYLATLMKKFAIAFLNQNIDDIMVLYSESFDSPDQGDKSAVREFLGGAIDQGFLEDAELDASEAETTINKEERTATIYPVEILAAFGSATLNLTLKNESGTWRIVGMEIEGI